MTGIGDRRAAVLYVRSQPWEYHPTLDYVEASFTARVGSMILPPGLYGNRPEGRELASGLPVQEVPLEQVRCVRLVLDIARRKKCPVEVIDVEKQAVPDAVIRPHPGDPESFPILVRADGARLAGLAEFTPGKVRRILSAAHPR